MASRVLEARRERHRRIAARLYERGRRRVVWLHGVLFFGGTLFLLYNAVAYFLDPQPPRELVDYLWIGLWSLLCCTAGYLRGWMTWRSLERFFGVAAA